MLSIKRKEFVEISVGEDNLGLERHFVKPYATFRGAKSLQRQMSSIRAMREHENAMNKSRDKVKSLSTTTTQCSIIEQRQQELGCWRERE